MDTDKQSHSRVFLLAILMSALLLAAVFVSFKQTRTRTSTIVLPGGITYLGPTPTQSPEPRAQSSSTVVIPSDTKWLTYQGKKFPYSFEYPDSLSLGVFPNDPFDGVTIFLEGTDAQANLFFRVEDLDKLNKKEFISKPKIEYAQAWWKDYTSWKGVASVTRFTNSQGMVGYRAKYLNDQGETPYDHLFFEVQNRPDLIIWMASSLLPASVFDRLADSLTWQP